MMSLLDKHHRKVEEVCKLKRFLHSLNPISSMLLHWKVEQFGVQFLIFWAFGLIQNPLMSPNLLLASLHLIPNFTDFFFKNIYLLCKNSQAHTTELKQYKTNIKYNNFFGEKTPNSQHQRKTRSHKETSHSGTASPQSPSQKEMFQAQWKRSVKSLDGVPGGGNSRNGLVCLHGICH